jgi:hypothetical protein
MHIELALSIAGLALVFIGSKDWAVRGFAIIWLVAHWLIFYDFMSRNAVAYA